MGRMSWSYPVQLVVAVLISIVFHLTQATRKATCNGWTLKAPDEGDFACNPLGVTVSMPGTRCMLHCDSGYRPKQEVLVCTENGGWVPTNSPECEADTTMTLVIVFSIVGSILLILFFSVLYARASKRCRGSRRKLEDEDPEAAMRRKEVNDTSTYYGRVKRLRRKRRLQAERQKQKTAQSQKLVTKQPVSTRSTKKSEAKKSKTQKRPTKEKSVPMKEKQKVKAKKMETPSNKSVSQPKKSPKTQAQANKPLEQAMRDLFCIPCYTCGDDKEKSQTKPLKRTTAKDVKVFSISEEAQKPKPKPKPRKDLVSSSSSSSESTSSSSYSSSSASSSEDEKVTPPKIEKKRIDDSVTPASRARKAPQKPPPPTIAKQPPPRPPAPRPASKIRKVSSDDSSESQPNSRGNSTNNLHERHQGANCVSSGYSSEGDRHRRKRGHGESALSKGKKDHAATRHRSAEHEGEKVTGCSVAKRMEILSPGDMEPAPATGNPYKNYPAALSYRQYQDFENDYRRTTGDYRPQYSNVKLIPLQSVKKETKKECEGPDKVEPAETQTKLKSVQGGVKYICISEEDEDESDEEDLAHTIRNNKITRHHRQRYENPAERDLRRHSPDYNRKPRATKHVKREKTGRSESTVKRDRKREIEGERIIDDGKSTKRRRDEKDKKYTKAKYAREKQGKEKHDSKSAPKRPDKFKHKGHDK